MRAAPLLLALASCADLNGLPAGEGWHERLEHAPLPPVWIQLPPGTDIGAACGAPRHPVTVQACAYRDYASGTCFIYAVHTREQMGAAWVRHEEEHCRGRDHD